MKDCVNIELNQEHLEYVLTGLELYCLNLNHIWSIECNAEQRDEKYANIFYLYHRLLNLSTDYEMYSSIPKPKKNKKVVNNILTFFK